VAILSKVNRLECETVHSLPRNFDAENGWNFTFIPLCGLISAVLKCDDDDDDYYYYYYVVVAGIIILRFLSFHFTLITVLASHSTLISSTSDKMS
jgi:hypothetical protein